MSNKYIAIVGSVLLIVILAGGGLWFMRKHKVAALNDGAATINVDATTGASGDQTNGGLNVSSTDNSTNLGQLANADRLGSQGAPALGSSASSNSSSSSQVDPSTFAQYDKYKDNTSALFGDVQIGSGATLSANQQASVLYKGWLTNGTLFDESRAGSDGKLQPLAFTVGSHQVITGMEEGVVGMKVGGTRLIIIPPGLGYGAQGQGPIPGGAVLVFEVQLLDAK